ncbi:MAG: hypothetical protein P8X50_16030, partial [Maritimibacter sp.]
YAEISADRVEALNRILLNPDTRVIFVTSSTFFSDGSIFAMSPNACAFLSAHTPPEDLAAVIEYHAERRIRER